MNLTDEINVLYRTYNTLSLIKTCGEETIFMSECLKALNNIIYNLKNKNIINEQVEEILIPIDNIIQEEKENG